MHKIPPQSQDLIFASYLTNNLKRDGSSCVSQHDCRTSFLLAVHRTLTPGGRLILVQDKVAIPVYKQLGQSIGFDVHSIEIPQSKALKSASKYIRLRATPNRRIKFMKKNYGYAPDSEEVQAWIKQGVIKEPEEYARPVIISMRKPRKGNEMSHVPTIPREILEQISKQSGVPIEQLKINIVMLMQ